MVKSADIIAKLVELAQISGSVNIKCQFQGEWLLEHCETAGQGIIHIVTQGEGWLNYASLTEPRQVSAGDILFFPRGTAHQLNYQPSFTKNLANMTACQQGVFAIKQNVPTTIPDFSLFCANFCYAPDAELIQSLPDYLIVRLESVQMNALVSLLQAEVAQGEASSDLVVNALASVLLTFIIRNYLQTASDYPLGFLKGWQDKRLKSLLKAILEGPEQSWSIAEMSHFAHLSRSQLVRLFQQYLATSPHAFLHKIRLQKACLLLKQSADSVLAIALATGFQSEAHFGKAFKKQYGLTPSQYRKEVSMLSDSKSMEFQVE